uniref:Uncharacterized protein n=1 Tax=Anopheles maculatus TaxID=74869 RepID=A0A182SHV6_9DIPT
MDKSLPEPSGSKPPPAGSVNASTTNNNNNNASGKGKRPFLGLLSKRSSRVEPQRCSESEDEQQTIDSGSSFSLLGNHHTHSQHATKANHTSSGNNSNGGTITTATTTSTTSSTASQRQDSSNPSDTNSYQLLSTSSTTTTTTTTSSTGPEGLSTATKIPTAVRKRDSSSNRISLGNRLSSYVSGGGGGGGNTSSGTGGTGTGGQFNLCCSIDEAIVKSPPRNRYSHPATGSSSAGSDSYDLEMQQRRQQLKLELTAKSS